MTNIINGKNSRFRIYGIFCIMTIELTQKTFSQTYNNLTPIQIQNVNRVMTQV